ncbi:MULTISPECIES: AraC family transcriptional regulator [unclassified Clostridium]|uniref:AraC family transcriptional regulator n=1 Tax=unclassified Clostridium TaxID=2614128 RepID=UPI000297F8BD|nr:MULTISPECIES: AraC family transcriptional regulator [unclassified Clostridium]EKQ50864.1 MAG: DNA-binding domain-containing protein, AraC-type [Clostridium sp. Maddingley MBC34-26]
MNNIRSISATKMSSFLNNFDSYGISIDNVIKYSGLNPLILSSPDNRLSGNEAKKIFDAAAKLTNDNNLGLHQGERLSKGFSNILGHILMNCSTLKECWLKYNRYEKIVDNTSISDLETIDNYTILSNNTIDKSLQDNRQFSDFKISGMLSYIKLLSNKDIRLHEVYFTHSKPEDTSEYERIFRCNVFFKKEVNALVLNNDLLNIKVTEPNEKLLSLFERNAEEILRTFDKNEYTEKVTEIILYEISKSNLPSIEFVAKKLLISTRSLQLYLSRENTSYVNLLRETRKNIAENHLKNCRISIDEIAYILGFSEASAFHRAFKNWTGITPIQFRKSLM